MLSRQTIEDQNNITDGIVEKDNMEIDVSDTNLRPIIRFGFGSDGGSGQKKVVSPNMDWYDDRFLVQLNEQCPTIGSEKDLLNIGGGMGRARNLVGRFIDSEFGKSLTAGIVGVGAITGGYRITAKKKKEDTTSPPKGKEPNQSQKDNAATT